MIDIWNETWIHTNDSKLENKSSQHFQVQCPIQPQGLLPVGMTWIVSFLQHKDFAALFFLNHVLLLYGKVVSREIQADWFFLGRDFIIRIISIYIIPKYMCTLWLVNQLWAIVLVNPRKNRASSEFLYKSNRPQVSKG